MKKINWAVILLLLIGLKVQAATIVSVADLDLKPNAGIDARPYVEQLLEKYAHQKNVVLYFPRGRYDFYPEEEQKDILKCKASVGFELSDLKGFTIDGGGSSFVFHGKMEIARIERCEDVELKNFSVDWDRPFISQGEIVNCTDSCLDIMIDKKKYPYEVKNGKVMFLGEGWKLPVLTMYSTLYDKKTKEIAYNTWDATLGKIFEQPVEEIYEGVLRFQGKPALKVAPHTTMVSLFHVRYLSVGISVLYSKDVILKDLSIYHALSHAFLGFRTENITMDNASVTVNDAKGRYFSSVADASHFKECRGKIRVLNCAHTGQGDDFINVHGTSVKISRVLDEYTLEVPAIHKGSGQSIAVGDEYWFITKESGQRGKIGVVKDKQLTSTGKSYLVSFKKKLPENIKGGDFMECKTWCASLEIRHCKILKRNRARGILVTTPKKVVIKDNYFCNAGTSILLEGDFNYWFESGANRNVLISGNVFDNCLTSGKRDATGGQWGNAVITINPSFIPKDNVAEPYHHNICIEHNVFRVFDAPLVRGVSTKGLSFKKNQVVFTGAYKPYTWQKTAFSLKGCREVSIKKNAIDPLYTTRVVDVDLMSVSEVDIDDSSFKIVQSQVEE